jgi:D-alanyl-D-alanine dipeptidase
VNKSRIRPHRFFLVCVCAFLAAAPLFAQSPTAPAPSLTPGSRPPDVPPSWKQLVGIYGQDKDTVIIFERDGNLFWKFVDGREFHVGEHGNTEFSALFSDTRPEKFSLLRDSSGAISSLTLGRKIYRRADAGSDPAHFYHVTPSKPLADLRVAALADHPPDEPGPFRKPDLVELSTLDPAFHLDIRYAQSNNFLSTPVYTQARAFLQRPAAAALLRSLNKLMPLGYGLLIHDAYRPWYVTKIFWDATPPEGHSFVADPQKGSKHNRGCAVDITLYDLSTGQPIEMPGLYDEMSPRSFPTFPGGTSLQRWHRDLLRFAIEPEGFTVDDNEWWHFDYKDWPRYPILNFPFENLGAFATSAPH